RPPTALHSSPTRRSSDLEFHWTNGLPPTAEESQLWTQARENDWEGLTITLRDDINDVEKTVTVDDIKALPRHSYIATHTCMQGWSATSRWTGARLTDLMDLLGPDRNSVV